MISLIAVFLCLILNAVFAASEIALVSLSRSSLREEIKHGNKQATLLLSLRENPERTLSVIQIGITFVGALAAAISGASADKLLSPYLQYLLGIGAHTAEIVSIIIIVLPLTYFSVVLGELVPKTLALRRPMFIALKTAPYLDLCARFISPVATLLEWSTKKILSQISHKQLQSEVELESSPSSNIMSLDHLSPANRQYVLNIFRIERTTLKEIFIPWKETVFIYKKSPIHEIEQIIVSSGHTRLPVLDEDRVVGILNAKELLAFHHEGNEDWLALIRPVIFLDEQTPILSALRALQDKHSHMAIVTNAGKRSGVVTMEAIFEEIVGDIYDEDDDGALEKILSVHRYNRKFNKPSGL